MASEALKRAIRKYDAANTKQFHLKLNIKTDADIIRRLETVQNAQGYIKDLIRANIKTGFWVFMEEPDGYYHFDCSECERPLMPGEWDNRKNPFEEGFAYCPYCGVKMTNW